jgi:hypothetical protein
MPVAALITVELHATLATRLHSCAYQEDLRKKKQLRSSSFLRHTLSTGFADVDFAEGVGGGDAALQCSSISGAISDITESVSDGTR